MSVSAKKMLYDELDFRIVSELKKDARSPAKQIAQAINSTERTVRRRINSLVEAGVIRFDVYVEPSAFGYVVSADIFIEILQDRENEIIEKLLERPEVFYLAYGQQRNEISIHAKFKDNGQMFVFLRDILPSLGTIVIKSYALIPRIFKLMHHWVPQEEDFI